MYSGTSPISLVEHCVTFRHDRRLLSLLGFVHNSPASRWSATKKENRFSFNGNEIMSSFQGRQFYRSTLYIFVVKFFFMCLIIQLILNLRIYFFCFCVVIFCTTSLQVSLVAGTCLFSNVCGSKMLACLVLNNTDNRKNKVSF